MPECPTCHADSEYTYKCSECGKPFDGDEPEGSRSPLGGGA
jgi:predicted amidophosphoribosyltransferase